ncbi:alpha/beta-hydrolase [Xylaria intraflava]|nr:alpha/beta-hydrolase [Xylaria intraflava]
MTTLAPRILGAKPAVGGFIAIAALCISAGLVWQSASTVKRLYEPSPTKTAAPALSGHSPDDAPYPPQDALPGARDVETPYGSIRVYEWGPKDGDRVLFVHGMSTPVVAFGDLAHEMVSRGYRIMMFDLFGRGYSDAPIDLTYDTRLYVTQLLLVIASSDISWTASPGFRLVGYSLGGGLCVAFTRYFPHLVRSLCLIAPGGLIRRHHIGWWSWFYYDSGLLPEILVKYLVRRRIRPRPKPVGVVGGPTTMPAGGEGTVNGDGDRSGGAQFDSAPISKTRPDITVASVVAWQVDNHEGFVTALLSSFRNAPVYAAPEDWEALSEVLKERGSGSAVDPDKAGLEGGKVLIVLGKDDVVVVPDEFIEDAYAALGQDKLDITFLEGGHELPFKSAGIIAASIDSAWKAGKTQ